MSRNSTRWERKSEEREARERKRSYTCDYRSRRRCRWERKSEEREMKNRDGKSREGGSNSKDKEYSPKRCVIGASGAEIIGYKSVPPNNTIMLKGLAQHIVETDIRQDIIHCGLMPRQVRLIRTKDTGASRGFAFVEFSTLEEATRWMNMKKGVLVLQDQYRVMMQYSIPKTSCQDSEKLTSEVSSDWLCTKCGVHNFKRRNNCFKCCTSRMESVEAGNGSDEVSSCVTKTIMLRNLDALTTEDSVIQVLNSLIPEIAKKICGVRIGRDRVASLSRGVCYLGTDSIVDALSLYDALVSLNPPLSIDGKSVVISYCMYMMGEKVYDQAIYDIFPNANQPSIYNLTDVDKLAEYSASHYAKSLDEYQQYLQYYKNYFKQQITAGNSITLQETKTKCTNIVEAAAVAQSIAKQKRDIKTSYVDVPSGIGGKQYPIPSITSYTYDSSSGYYYDFCTGLHYDPNSKYYWNSVIQKHLYYDTQKLTYLLVPTTNIQEPVKAAVEPVTKKLKVDKQDKSRVAKKIVKDMERWTKTLNQKKEPSSMSAGSEGSVSPYASADIGYSILEKNNNSSSLMDYSYKMGSLSQSILTASPKIPYIENVTDEEARIDETTFLDFTHLICNLCKRQLTSAEALSKHATLSDLHKKNLEARKSHCKTSEDNEKPVYRDRAQERRLKFKDSVESQTNLLQERYLKSKVAADKATAVAVNEPISTENIGNRLLHKMGWTNGQGLGKTNQGRTTIIQTEHRNGTVGLGNKMPYTAVSGESYKDSVKKILYARYQELD